MIIDFTYESNAMEVLKWLLRKLSRSNETSEHWE